MSIFDLITSTEIASYWTTLTEGDTDSYVGELLFPATKQIGIDIKWIKGAKGLPVILKPSAYDTAAIPRPRISFDKMEAEMPYFKESKYIDEHMRQQLNLVIQTGNNEYIEAVVSKIFDDQTDLLRGAKATREVMRMMAITTGVVSIVANGQDYFYDYDVTHKGNAAVSWSDHDNSDPIEDIRLAMEEVKTATGRIITRVIMNTVTWRHLRQNKSILQQIYVLSKGEVKSISDATLKQYIKTELNISVELNDLKYTDASGSDQKFVPDNTVSLLPDGDLGETVFGTTPEESDLMTSKIANVSIVDTGVAITTIEHANPVNVETVVSMICLPSFPTADQIYIMDTEAA